MKSPLLKTILTGCLALWGMCSQAQSTCTAAFTYTVGSGGQVNFTNTSTGTGMFTNSNWDFGDSYQANSASPTHTFLFNGTYAVTLAITDSIQGCSSTFTDSVTINNAQNNFSCNAGYTYTLSSGGTVNFTNTSISNLAGHGYDWSFGDGSAHSTTQSPSHTYYYNGTYYITTQITDSLGNGVCSYSQYITVTSGVNCNLQASFTYTVSSGGQVNFTNTSTGSGSYNSSWDFGDNNYSSSNSPSNTYAYNGGYVVSLHVVDMNGGGGCGSTFTDSITVTTGTPAPTCNASFTYTLGASGLASFTGSQTGTIGTPVYGWSFGDGGSTSATLNPSNTYAYNGTYNVYFYVSDSLNPNWGCTYSQQIVITNTANPPVNCHDSVYFYMTQDTMQASTWNVNLYSNGLNTMTGATWTWGDGTSSTGLSPNHTYSTPGWYSICVTAFFSCGDSSSYCQSDSVYRSSAQMISVHVINMTTGIQTNTNSMTSLQAYPNPFTDDLTIKLTSYENKPLTCSIFDLMGNLVRKESVLVNKGDNEFKLKTADMGKGVYFIQVSGGGKASTLKVVK